MKKIIMIILGAMIILSCNEKMQKKNLSENEKFVKTYFEYFNNHNWVELANMYIETSEFKDPTLGQGIIKQTRKQIIDKYTKLNKMFPNLHDKVIKTYPSGERHIIVEFISTGTAADNSKFELPICTIFTIENGKIRQDFTYFDNFDEKNH